jgi:putative transposase
MVGSTGVHDIRGMDDLPQRRSIRMRGYDYANEGAYFVTICTHDRRNLFGSVVEGVMVTNALGGIAQRCWDAIPEHMPHVDVGPFVVMPDHVHGIVVIRERVGGVGGAGTRHVAPGIRAVDDAPATDVPANAPSLPVRRTRHDASLPPPGNDGPRPKPPGIPRGSLGQVIQSYKSAVTRIAYRDGVLSRGIPVWQGNYWDDIIRGDGAYERIAQYIRDNPANWAKDRFKGRP